MSDNATITVTAEARRRLLEAASETGGGIIAMASDALTEGLVPAALRHVPTLDEAAETFLAHMPPAQVDLIRDLCAEHGRTPAQYILAYCKLAHERGETAASTAEADWRDAADRGRVPAATIVTCAWCKKEFTATRPGQRFCPDDPDSATPSCGRQASLATIQQSRPRGLTPAGAKTAKDTQV